MDGAPLAEAELVEWRCPSCNQLQAQYHLPYGGTVKTKCPKCRRKIWLNLPMPMDTGRPISPKRLEVDETAKAR